MTLHDTLDIDATSLTNGSPEALPRVFSSSSAPSPNPGSGSLELTRINGKTVVTRSRATSPLKLLAPRSHNDSAWVFTSTYGGGLVAGDHIQLDVTLNDSTICLLSTQASTKVYRSPAAIPCRQTVDVAIGVNATCVAIPHPVTCFKNSRYIQRQNFDLATSATLVLVDWFTSGRHANGERWAFEDYDSRTAVRVNGRLVFRDATRLNADDGPIDFLHRTGGYDCFAYAVIMGARVQTESSQLLDYITSCPVPSHANTPLIFSASPIRNGVVIRAAGTNAQIVCAWLGERLAFVSALLGEDPWSRLW